MIIAIQRGNVSPPRRNQHNHGTGKAVRRTSSWWPSAGRDRRRTRIRAPALRAGSAITARRAPGSAMSLHAVLESGARKAQNRQGPVPRALSALRTRESRRHVSPAITALKGPAMLKCTQTTRATTLLLDKQVGSQRPEPRTNVTATRWPTAKKTVRGFP